LNNFNNITTFCDLQTSPVVVYKDYLYKKLRRSIPLESMLVDGQLKATNFHSLKRERLCGKSNVDEVNACAVMKKKF